MNPQTTGGAAVTAGMSMGGDEPGCGCVVPAARPTRFGAVISMLLGLVVLAYRRRRPADGPKKGIAHPPAPAGVTLSSSASSPSVST